jgi:hypothetical protein
MGVSFFIADSHLRSQRDLMHAEPHENDFIELSHTIDRDCLVKPTAELEFSNSEATPSMV